MDSEDKKEYEISFLLKHEGDAQEVLKLLKQHGAEITFEGPLKHLQLTYKIKHHTEASFGYLHFKLAPGHLAELNHDLGTKPAIIRFLIITPPFMRARVSQPKREAPPIQPSTQPKSALPLSNEALEKKIEEILQ